VKLFGTSNFIQIYDNALTKKECDILISQFEKSDDIEEGRFYRDGLLSTDYSYKKCKQLAGTNFDKKGCSKEVRIINNITFPRLRDYVSKYSRKYDGLIKYLSPWAPDSTYNFQKYDGEDDGFKVWHCEHGSHPESALRILAWMFYLNNAKSGTEFLYYPTVNAKRGRLVIWPAGFTHTHRGVIPNKGVKYILTGWFMFKENK